MDGQVPALLVEIAQGSVGVVMGDVGVLHDGLGVAVHSRVIISVTATEHTLYVST